MFALLTPLKWEPLEANQQECGSSSGGSGAVGAAQGRGAVTGSAARITLKGHLGPAPHSAALSLQVTEWGGFHRSCALGELGGYKKRRRRAAGRQRRTKAKRRKPERSEKRQKAPDCSSPTDASMGSFSAATMGLLLFLACQLPGQTGANPVYSSVSNADLMDFKVGPGKGPPSGTRGLCDSVLVIETSLSPRVFLCKEFAGPLGGQDAFRR